MTIDAAFTRFPSLTTERLLLRQIRLADADAFFTILSDPQVMQYYGQEPYQSIEDVHTWIQSIQERYVQRAGLRWAVTLKGDDTPIGSCTFFHFGPAYGSVETGYELHRAYWRQGIMGEAMTAVLNYGFSDLGLHRIEAIIDPVNEGSRSLLLKLGFTYEGTLRQRFFFRGKFEDEAYFGLLKDEWLQTR